MTVLNADTRVPEAIRDSLAALPEFAPSERLRERLALSLATPPRSARAPSRWRYLAAAAAIALVAFGLGRWDGAQQGPGAVATPTLASLSRNQALEAEVVALRATHAAMGDQMQGELALSRIDHQLQAAYDRGAPLAELEGLWRQRELTLSGLVQSYRRPASAVRI